MMPNARRGEWEPPGPEIVFRLNYDQAVDVFEAYKASRFGRPRTVEIVKTMAAALARVDPERFGWYGAHL
jgi:hypothetical protein